MIARQPLPPRTPHSELLFTKSGQNGVMKGALLLLEQNLSKTPRIAQFARTLRIVRQRLKWRLYLGIGLIPAGYRRRLRVKRSVCR